MKAREQHGATDRSATPAPRSPDPHRNSHLKGFVVKVEDLESAHDTFIDVVDDFAQCRR